MVQAIRGMIGMGLMLGVGALPAAAQSLALPAVDPVGISRSGAQVAYGYSLEAATANPALLSGLKEKGGFYLALGLEMSSFQQSLESNQEPNRTTTYSFDRNRTVGGFGLALRVSPALTLGLKLDEPYLRHGKLPDDAPSRYFGDGISLAAQRLEGQAAWALTPNLSLGLGVGVARLSYESTNVMRLNVPSTPPIPDSLVEQRVGESGNKVVPSYSLGLRWAINPRWTVGFTHQSGLKGDLDLRASFRGANLGYFAFDGLSVPLVGTDVRALALLAASSAQPGANTFELPSQTTLGFRQRINPMMTWEADLRWTSASLRVPTFATVQTPTGSVAAPGELPRGKSHLGLAVSAEVELGKFWTLRSGLSLDQRGVEESSVEPLLGGARTAAFSFGAGYKVWGGELSLGYQYRQSEDQDTRSLDGVWSAAGFRSAGTKMRLEGMGHLMALGFKKTF
jgi:long-subunit fatty acid transport protein